MRHRRCILAQATLAGLAFATVRALAFSTTVVQQPRVRCLYGRKATTATTVTTAGLSSLHGHGNTQQQQRQAVGRGSSFPCYSDGGVRHVFGSGACARTRSQAVVMMARASSLRAEQKRRVKNAAPVILTAKQKKKASRERRASYREKFACSGSRLIKLQKEEDECFYIGFVGENRAGRAQALKAVEAFLKRATELKVAKYYQKDANIKLVDAGNVRMSEMPGNDERKLGLLRHCDLLVHVARCFDLYAPKPYTAWGVTDDDVGDTTEQETRARAKEEEEKEEEKVIDWPLSATPLADVKSARADMASVDLHFIQERHRSNHTKWFWRDRRRAFDEQTAVRLIEPALEDAYAADGEIRPVGPDFKNGCLQDEKDEKGATVYNTRLRAAIQEIGFLTPKPVIYVANLPLEAVTPEVSDDPQDAVKEVSESAAAIAKVALAHAETIVGLNREYGVPAIAACLRDRGGQEALGATVFKAIPGAVLARDPKLKKAAKSAAAKSTQRKQSPPRSSRNNEKRTAAGTRKAATARTTVAAAGV